MTYLESSGTLQVNSVNRAAQPGFIMQLVDKLTTGVRSGPSRLRRRLGKEGRTAVESLVVRRKSTRLHDVRPATSRLPPPHQQQQQQQEQHASSVSSQWSNDASSPSARWLADHRGPGHTGQHEPTRPRADTTRPTTVGPTC